MPSYSSLPETDKFTARTDPVRWPGLDATGVRLSLRREDLLFPQLSGNKFRKLHHNLAAARKAGAETLLTFGGAYSNHIHATAEAGRYFGLRTIGLIRGEELAGAPLNPTLMDARQRGMQLEFISREAYRRRGEPGFQDELQERFGPFWLLPEGGTNALAVKGCSEILREEDSRYDLFCCPVGTGGTLAGLVASGYGEVWGYPVVKAAGDYPGLRLIRAGGAWKFREGYAFGGYARVPEALVQFIRAFHKHNGVALDAVYTGKMLFGVLQDILQGAIPSGSQVLAIHTGGLQGNRGMNAKLTKKGLPLLPL